MSGIISAEPFNAYFPEILKDSTWQGFVTAIYEIGCLAGAITMLLYGDTLGRRRAIMIGAIIMIIGTIIQVTPIKGHHAGAQFILGRTITVSLGISCCRTSADLV
jgi:MFS family permease